jgi:hypothetical protein
LPDRRFARPTGGFHKSGSGDVIRTAHRFGYAFFGNFPYNHSDLRLIGSFG